MDDITREKLLKIALVAVGAIFFTIYPLSLIWPIGKPTAGPRMPTHCRFQFKLEAMVRATPV